MKIVGIICGADVVAELEIENGKIKSIANFEGEITGGIIGGKDFIISPVLIDIQVNGS